MSIKVAIADDHPLVAEGLYKIINAVSHIQVTGIYANGDALQKGLTEEVPDVLLLDMQFPDTSGSELALYIRKHYPDIAILILSGLDSSILIKNMIQLGCKGYLLKNTTDKNILMSAIEKIYYTNDIYLDPFIKEDLLTEILTGKKRAKDKLKLSKREKEILGLIVEEYSNPEIADKLCLSLRTVENHKYNLFQKLNVKNSVGLIKAAMQYGLRQ